MLSFDIQGEAKEIQKHFRSLTRKAIPRAMTKAINKTAQAAVRETIKEGAKDLKLPQKILRNRLDTSGNIKGKRIRLYKANRANRMALIRFYNRGIPVTQIRTKGRARGGVSARGGRFYQGAFLTRVRATGQEIVLKRRNDRGVRPRRLLRGDYRSDQPLMAPRVGIRQRLGKRFAEKTGGTQGRRRFRVEFASAAGAEARKLGQ